MNEDELRVKACIWLRKHFPLRNYHLEPMVFHGLSFTISDFLHKKFKGSELVSIPRYNSLFIRPDIIALTKFEPNNEGSVIAWVIGECKADRVNVADFRQAVHYANVAGAYEGYLFYEGDLSREVIDSIKAGGHLYRGTNKWGKAVMKQLIFVKYEDEKFAKLGW